MDKSKASSIFAPIARLLNKELIVFLVFLIMSAVFWFVNALNETYEKEISVPVTICEVPQNVIITDGISDTIRVTLRDKGYNFLPYLYGNIIGELRISFITVAKESGKGNVSVAELQKILRQKLYASTKIIAVKAEQLDFYYNYGLSKKVPVLFFSDIKTSESYYLAETQITPDSVTIYASQSKLDSIKEVHTLPYSAEDFHDTLSTEVAIRSIRGVKIMPAKVRVKLIADMLTEQTISVPVTTVNMPAGFILRTFPTSVNVKVVVGRNKLSLIKPQNFRVVADYNSIIAKPSDKCPLTLQQVPREVTNATLETKQVDYLIEKTQ